MKIALSTRKGDFTVDLSIAHERNTFTDSLPTLITEKQFVSARLIEVDGEAKFSSLAGLLKALNSYKD